MGRKLAPLALAIALLGIGAAVGSGVVSASSDITAARTIRVVLKDWQVTLADLRRPGSSLPVRNHTAVLSGTRSRS